MIQLRVFLRVILGKNNTSSTHFSLDYKASLYFFLERQKVKRKQLNKGYLSQATLGSFSPKLKCWQGQHFNFYIPHKSQSYFLGSNFQSIKTIKKRLSALSSIQKMWGRYINYYPPLKEDGEIRSPPLRGGSNTMGKAYRNTFDKEQNTLPVPVNNLNLEKKFNRLSGVSKPFNFKGLNNLSVNNAPFREHYKQDSKQVLTKILLFLKKETLKKSYQTPAVIITKVNQQLRKIYYLKVISNKLLMPFPSLIREADNSLYYPPWLPLAGLAYPDNFPMLNMGEVHIKHRNPAFSIKRKLSDFKSPTFTLMDKLIKKLIWTMLKKQYSNLSKSVIVNKNWFFLVVKNVIKNDLLHTPESNPLKSQSQGSALTYAPRPLGSGGKKSYYFQQMSYFFSVSLVPFNSFSLKKEKSCLIQLSLPNQRLGRHKCGQGPHFEKYFFFWSKELLLMQSVVPPHTLNITVKSGGKSNRIDLAVLFFLKINLYNTYTVMYTSEKLKNKSHLKVPSFETTLAPRPIGSRAKNEITKNSLFGITHYLDSSKRKQSVLKMSNLFPQFSIISDYLVMSKLDSLGAFVFLVPTNRNPLEQSGTQLRSRRFKGLSVGTIPNIKENEHIPTDKFKNVSILYSNSSNKLKSSKKQKLFSIWKNQNRVTSFCNYSF